MIYAYKNFPHRIEEFHENISYFFAKMIAKDLVVYDEDVLLKKEFIPIINNSKKLVNNLKEITRQYHLLGTADKFTVNNAMKNNCKIENLCGNSGGYNPIKYSEITDDKFRELLKGFLTELWEGYHFVDAIKDNFGTVQQHFLEFKGHQSAHVCPFCGLLPLKPAKGLYRNAYDHYIPKALYPFVSINYQNLFPICTDCNSDEKKATDTLYRGVVRREVFFPLDMSYNSDHLEVSINPLESHDKITLKTLLDEIDWNIAISLAGAADSRLVSWDEIFHIKRRYKENLIDYQKTWFEDFIIKRYKQDMEDGLSFKRFQTKLIDEAQSQIKHNPLSILRFVYFNFIFSIPNISDKLNETIK